MRTGQEMAHRERGRGVSLVGGDQLSDKVPQSHGDHRYIQVVVSSGA